jgi:hypothetical protein
MLFEQRAAFVLKLLQLALQRHVFLAQASAAKRERGHTLFQSGKRLFGKRIVGVRGHAANIGVHTYRINRGRPLQGAVAAMRVIISAACGKAIMGGAGAKRFFKTAR